MKYTLVLGKPHLVRLWLSQVLSAVGDQLYNIAIIWIAVERAGSAAGFVAAAGTIAGLLFTPVGGIYADRWKHRKVMIVVDLLRAFCVFALALLGQLAPLSLWQLGLVAALVSGLSAFFDPALIASLPELAGESSESLKAINALVRVNKNLARTIGPGLSAGLASLLPLHQFFTLDAVTFLVSAAAVFSVAENTWSGNSKALAPPPVSSIWQDLYRGSVLVARHEELSWVCITSVISNTAYSAVITVGFALLAKQFPGSGVGNFGYILAAFGLGGSISLLTALINTRRYMFSYAVGLLGFALGLLVMASSHSLPMVCLGAFLAPGAATFGTLMASLMMQIDTPAEHLGKVYGLSYFLVLLGDTIGLLLAPTLFSLLSPRNGIYLCAAIFAAVGISVILKFGLKLHVARAPEHLNSAG